MADAERAPTARVERLPDDILAIDTFTGGMSNVTAGYLIPAPRPVLIECGPALAIDNVLAGLRQLGMDSNDLAYLVVTHVHLDHAGGAGDIAAAFPSARIVVSEVGAPHLHDPEKLNASSRRVYGEVMDEVYGECTPIPASRLLGVGDREVLDLGGGRTLELLYTPGHAKHHIAAWDDATGTIFTGDSVGVKLPGMLELRPATPPPDFNLETAIESIERYIERAPDRVYLAHYGALDPPLEALDDAIERLRLWASVAEEAYRADGGHDELEHIVEMLRARFADEVDPSSVPDDPHAEARVALLSGFESNAAGLHRYLRRRDEGTLTRVG